MNSANFESQQAGLLKKLEASRNEDTGAFMVRALFCLLILSACRTPEPTPATVTQRGAPAGPTVASEHDPASWKHNGRLTDAQADALCAKKLPGCKHPFGRMTMRPNPCANQGTACRYLPSPNAGTWSCGCEACSSSEDCAPTEYCGMNASPCSYVREALKCLPGPRPPPQPCLEPSVP